MVIYIKEKIKYLFIGILFISISQGTTVAQQDPMYTQYMFNTLAINPAYAGSREMLSLMLLTRQQWVGFDGAPSTSTFSAHSPVYNNMALGTSLIYDTYGPASQTSFFIDYAYHLTISSSIKISLGLSGGINYYSVDFNNLYKTANADDAYNNPKEQKTMPNAGFGIYMYSPKFYLGLSCPHIIENQLNDEASNTNPGKEIRHYYFMSGFIFRLSNDFMIRPSILTRVTEAAPLSIDFNINTLLKEKFWLGGMYRLNDSFGAIVQYQITPQLKLGYAFDMNTNQLKSQHSGTHELMINYEFNFKKEGIINPRYF